MQRPSVAGNPLRVLQCPPPSRCFAAPEFITKGYGEGCQPSDSLNIFIYDVDADLRPILTGEREDLAVWDSKETVLGISHTESFTELLTFTDFAVIVGNMMAARGTQGCGQMKQVYSTASPPR